MEKDVIHPLWLRTTHWINAMSVVIMVTSAWHIYDAAPFPAVRIPAAITLGGWLGGAKHVQAVFVTDNYPGATGKTRGTTGSAAVERKRLAALNSGNPAYQPRPKEFTMNKMTVVSGLMSLSLLLAGGSVFAADEMKKDDMGKDGMKKEAMAKDCTKDAMGKDCMAKDGMKKSSMAKDTMKKDAMGKDGMKKE